MARDRRATQLAVSLKAIQTEIETHLINADWEDLSLSLLRLIAIGERQGQRELCLKAQTIRDLAIYLSRGLLEDHDPKDLKARIKKETSDLEFYLRHFKWSVAERNLGFLENL